MIKLFKDISTLNIPLIDFHLHTCFTDGKNTVEEMFEQAVALGLKQVLFSEHVRKSGNDWFNVFADQVRRLPSDHCGALVGAEVRIEDFAGSLDCSSMVAKQCDLLVASVHRFPGAGGSGYTEFSEVSAQEALVFEYKLTSAALENPEVDIIGHLFGMSLRQYRVLPPSKMIKELVEKAARYEVAIEVNSHYHPDPWMLLDMCNRANTPISLGSDAHHINEVGKIIRVLRGDEQPWIL